MRLFILVKAICCLAFKPSPTTLKQIKNLLFCDKTESGSGYKGSEILVATNEGQAAKNKEQLNKASFRNYQGGLTNLNSHN